MGLDNPIGRIMFFKSNNVLTFSILQQNFLSKEQKVT